MSDPRCNYIHVIRVDCGAASFLPICQHCAWRGLPRSTKEHARTVAEQHAVNVHGDRTARNAAAKRRERAA